MKLSIITINYNNIQGLEKTYRSVVSQTWQDFEWIIIDGGSTDGSKEFIEEHQDKFSYWCSEPDTGVYNAMNKGISKASGEYSFFLNSGDIFHDEKNLYYIWQSNHDGDVVYGDWIRLYPDRSVIMKSPQNPTLAWFLSNNICHQAMFIKTSLLKKKGYDERFKIFGDWARWIEMSYEGRSFEYVPIIVCDFAVGGLSDNAGELGNREREMAMSIVPSNIRDCLERLNRYEYYSFNQEAIELIFEKRIYRRLLHSAVIITRLFKLLDNAIKKVFRIAF